MAKITKHELQRIIKEEIRKQTSRRRKLFEENEEDFKIIDGDIKK